ncbi:hypothetical protein [Paracoccus tegillarcae]|uniref:hypothetical protein n=1 Tax=Paracoccus tegillarcae TaxID=1529068 RepID=UPI0018E67C86|nr:hypothetical protein [Paracoccus tegillarcae]
MAEARNTGSQQGSREERLRAALRANLARRKAQARARADNEEQAETAKSDTGETEGDE